MGLPGLPVECNGWQIRLIVRARYRCTTNAKYNLCSECFTIKNKKDKKFEKLNYPWEAAVGHAMVAFAPLAMTDRSMNMKFLHFILLDLDYMNRGMLDKRPGVYVLNTKRGVGVFQQEHVIDGGGPYDQRSAKMLEGVIRKRKTEMVSRMVIE